MKAMNLSVKVSITILRFLSILILFFVVIEDYHLFDSSLEKNYLFYYVLSISISYCISAVGLWFLKRWAVILFIVTSLGLIPGFIHFNTLDKLSVGLFLIVIIGAIINWKNIK